MKKGVLILIFFLLMTVACGKDTNSKSNDVTIISAKENQKIISDPLPENNNKNSEVRKFDLEVSKGIDYEIVTEVYNYKRIKIKYPQIINWDERDKQNKVNEIVKEEAYGGLNNFSQDELNEYSLDLDYRITWKSNNLISIQYSGIGNSDGTAHPNHEFYTTNIDINKGIKVKLGDLINIDENFVKKFKEGKLQSTITEQRYILDEYTSQEWVDRLTNSDSKESEISCYLTEDSLGISVPVSHAVGDHAEFEIKYQDIINNIKAEQELWKGIPLK
ncbi:PdaC/SigV domain-containing protein [Paenibacillus elgii]|uniref:PdaC/SigV domain-containing protein n=1 Tax=Paenibacillus elgii TaxID=189691 RepID=UPI0013CF5076|nr:DUF4163 domain-containing protein [Paenibacillus elgii]